MKKLLKMALALLPLAVMTSCAADDPLIDDSDGIAKQTETRYLQVTLANATGTPDTRFPDDLPDNTTGEYQSGEKNECKIKTLDFYFYDRKKQFHSHVSMTIEGNVADADGDGALDPDGITDENHDGLHDENNVSGFYHCNVPVELVQGETLPNYVICIVNAVEATQYENKSMDDAQSSILYSLYSPEPDNSGKQDVYFGMSNSVYYGLDEVTGEDNVLIMATPFDTSKLKKKSELESLQATVNSSDPKVTEEQKNAAKAEIEGSTIDIYVERYAVKVNLDLSSTTYTPYPAAGYSLADNATPYELTFHPTGWNVNATEKSFFFVKAFREPNAEYIPETEDWTGGYTNVFATKAQLDDLLFSGWNSPSEHRCFWARTPGYYANRYPVVADDVDNKNGATGGDYIVDYWSYAKAEPLTADLHMTKYVMETTMKNTRLTGDGMPDQYIPSASIPSITLTGYYTIQGQERPMDFYLYGKDNHSVDRIYAGADNIDGVGQIKDKMLNDQTVILTRSETGQDHEGNPVYRYTSLNNSITTDLGLKGIFDVQHPTKEVRTIATTATVGEAETTEIKVAADIVVLQIMKVPTNGQVLYFYNTQKNMYEPITDANLTLVNRMLLQNLGGAHYYNKGMAFFSAPIFHWGWYRTGNENRTDAEGNAIKLDDWDWKKMKTGDFGLVRNHIYEMKIGNISGLGTAIKDPNDPIVPPAEKVGYAVHFHVNIQKWAVLPVQNWDF